MDRDERLRRFLQDVRTEHERNIGEAFELALLADLPPELLDFETYFQLLPLIDEARKAILLGSPAVQSSPRSHKLVARGITPMTIFSAAEAISMLINRKVRRRKFTYEQPIFLCRSESSSDSQCLDKDSLTSEIQFVTRQSRAVSCRVLDWLLDAARHKPLLFEGFVAEPSDNVILLRHVCDLLEGLTQRWSYSI